MSDSLRFLSYNTHLFGGGTLNGLVLPTYYDDARAEAIVRVLAESGADAIGLSEVWPDDLARRISDALSGTYHAYRPPPSTKPLKVQSSGLLLLSKTPFVEGSEGFDPFDNLASPDNLADKGVAWAATDVTVGDRDLRLLMFLSHTQADYTGENHRWERQRNIETIAVNLSNQWLDQPGSAVVLFGDLNVVAEDPAGNTTSEYEETRAKLRKLDDVYRKSHPRAGQDPGYTYDGPRNTLIPRFAPKEVGWQQRIDYHFFGGPLAVEGQIRTRIPSRAFVSEIGGEQNNLSDHEPLVSEWSPDV